MLLNNRYIICALVVIAVGLLIVAALPTKVFRREISTRQKDNCLGCHRKLDPGMVKQWAGSRHAEAHVGCESCHGGDHDNIFGIDGEVSAGVCAGCHSTEYKEFKQSLHAQTEIKAKAVAPYLSPTEAIHDEGCLGCHSIGRKNRDGSVGRCNFCHSGHSFSSDEANQPEACGMCHRGPDQPQMEAYTASKHGILYKSTRDAEIAPTCVTCHMPGRTHNTNTNLTLGTVGGGAVLADETPSVPMRTITQDVFDKKRIAMLKLCINCHSSKLSRRSLRYADSVKKESDFLVTQGAMLLRDLYNEISPTDNVSTPLTGQQISDLAVNVEERFFQMFKYHNAAAWKYAYHNSPNQTHNFGAAPLKADLAFIKSEIRKIRELARLKRKAEYEKRERESGKVRK